MFLQSNNRENSPFQRQLNNRKLKISIKHRPKEKMGDFILPNDTLEFQNQRQSIKISYLQQELKQLQEHVQDLENIIKLNKEALRIAVNGGTQQQPNRMRSVAAGNESTNRSEDITTVIDNKGLHMLIDQLQLENIRLLHIIDKVTKQRNQAQSQVPIAKPENFLYNYVLRH